MCVGSILTCCVHCCAAACSASIAPHILAIESQPKVVNVVLLPPLMGAPATASALWHDHRIHTTCQLADTHHLKLVSTRKASPAILVRLLISLLPTHAQAGALLLSNLSYSAHGGERGLAAALNWPPSHSI